MTRPFLTLAPLLLAASVLLWSFRYGWHSFRYIAEPRNVPTVDEHAARVGYELDFAGPASERNLRFAPVDQRKQRKAFFEQRAQHPLRLHNLSAESVTLTSYGSFIEYEWGTLRFMTIHLAPRAVSYASAIAVMDRAIAKLGLAERFSSKALEARTGEVTDNEIWPMIQLPYVELWPQLGCNSEVFHAAQVEAVVCLPFFIIEPRASENGGNAASSDAN